MKYTNIFIWSSIDRFGVAGISFLGNIYLARLLSPDDFGLVGMVAIFRAIAFSFANCGLSDGLIHMETPQRKDYSTVFVFNVLTGLFVLLLFYVLSSPVARFFGRDELIVIIKLLGLSVLISALTFTEETRLRKLLKNKTLAIVRISSTLGALVISIAMAYNGFEYLSLVYLQILVPALTLVLFIFLSNWRPQVDFDKNSFKHLFGFGYHLFLTYISNQIGRNLVQFVLGKKYPSAVVGVYSQAQKMQETPLLILDSIFCGTSYPILANESNKEQKYKMTIKLLTRVVLINGAMAVVLFILAPFLIVFLYGEKWVEAIPIFKILLLSGFLYAIQNFIQMIFKAYGVVKTIKRLSYAERILQILILFITVPHGLNVIIYGQVLTIFISLAVHFFIFNRMRKKVR